MTLTPKDRQMDSLLTYYQERGWLSWRDHMKRHSAAIYSPRSLTADLRQCECNDKPPSVFLWEHQPLLPGSSVTYEVEICGEWSGIWLKLGSYNLRSIYEIEKAIMALRDAWQIQTAHLTRTTP